MFCVFSGPKINQLRDYLNNEEHASIYDTEGTMYDHEAEEAEADRQVTGMMHATGLGGVDDEDMNDEDEAGEGSQYGEKDDS